MFHRSPAGVNRGQPRSCSTASDRAIAIAEAGFAPNSDVRPVSTCAAASDAASASGSRPTCGEGKKTVGVASDFVSVAVLDASLVDELSCTVLERVAFERDSETESEVDVEFL